MERSRSDRWGSSTAAAALAYISMQKPVSVALHAHTITKRPLHKRSIKRLDRWLTISRRRSRRYHPRRSDRLLPVRLEARYFDSGKGLRIRIFPDQIHADAHEPELTPAEACGGIAYWNAVFGRPMRRGEIPHRGRICAR